MLIVAAQHWPILRKLGHDFANRVRSFMVIGRDGEGAIVVTEDGEGFWLGTMDFGWNETRSANQPTVLDVSNVVSMAHGNHHILLLNKQGEIYSMGFNDRGQLGLGTEDEETKFSPQIIYSPHKFTSVRCGGWHSLALTENGKVFAWGSNDSCQVGVSNSTESFSSFRQIFELNSHRIVAVECGSRHSLALTYQGDVYAWGANEWGQLGDGSETTTHIPTRIPILSPIQSMVAGLSHTLLLTQTGEVFACGDNEHGQLCLPRTSESSSRLVKVAGMPPISQIASHSATNLLIAMSSDQRCFVWGELCLSTSIFTPRELPPFYSTVESPLSFFSIHRNTPHQVIIPETSQNRLSAGLSRMFDNTEFSDVQFVVEQRTIHAHLSILSIFSNYFVTMFSERWLAPVDPEDPIVRMTIPDYTYEAFHAFLHFLYTDCLEVHPNLLPEVFELATQYLIPELQQFCISRMRTALTPTTCCLYYPLTHRHSFPELATFQQELVQFASTRYYEIAATDAYQSMEQVLRDNLTKANENL